MKRRMIFTISISAIFLVLAFFGFWLFKMSFIDMTGAERVILSQLIAPGSAGALKVILLYLLTFLFLPALYGAVSVVYILFWPWQRADETMGNTVIKEI